MLPFLSIIVPVYKVENKISRCVESILNQSFSDFELILIDDGSPDKSGLICDKYAAKDTRIFVLHQKNRGVSAARNLGIEKASGKWLVFIDSDDYVEKDFLKNLVGEEDLQETDFVNTGDKLMDENSGMMIYETSFPKGLIKLNSEYSLRLLDKLAVFNYGVVCCHLFNVSVIKKYRIRFLERLSLHEDHLFFFDYLKYVRRIWLRADKQYCYMIDFSVNSLSKAKKQPDELFLAYNVLQKSFLNFLVSMNLTKTFRKLPNLNNFLIRLQLRTISSCFENGFSKIERIKYLNQYSRKDVIKYYRPKSLKGVLQFILLVAFPRSIVDSIFRIVAKG